MYFASTDADRGRLHGARGRPKTYFVGLEGFWRAPGVPEPPSASNFVLAFILIFAFIDLVFSVTASRQLSILSRRERPI